MYTTMFMLTWPIALVGFILSVSDLTTAAATPSKPSTPRCYHLPGDPEWPSETKWNSLNKTVGGRLIRSVPVAQPCYGPNFDAARCSAITNQWISSQTLFVSDPVSVMAPYFQNNSCNPFLRETGGTCSIGTLAQYAINVKDASSVIAGIRFARSNNIRLIVKNTGHDFLGRSSGKGSLALWTHNLKTISFTTNYKSRFYSGLAVRVGAGVESSELYTAAGERGYRVVAGNCPTVGVAGGWAPGGGHSPLSSSDGLGADNALEYEVVTMDGQHTTASPSKNADLYWALSGGGGGTYAIVVSITLKARLDGPVAGSEFSFTNTNPDTYWAAVEAWTNHLAVMHRDYPTLRTAVSFSNASFSLSFGTLADAGPRANIQMNAALQPFFQTLLTLNIPLTTNRTTISPSFLAHYTSFSILPLNTGSLGGRFIPRSLLRSKQKISQLITTCRTIATNPPGRPGQGFALFIIDAMDVSTAHLGLRPDQNSVSQVFRDAAFNLLFAVLQPPDASWGELRSLQDSINGYQDAFRELTPGGGSYASEASFDWRFWKEDYFGGERNYERSLGVKRKYDPEGVLWGYATVGSDLVEVAGDGRLCRR